MTAMEPRTRIIIRKAKQRFARRRQWRFLVVAPNGRRISDRDTYANAGDAARALRNLINGAGRVDLEIHYENGNIQTERLR